MVLALRKGFGMCGFGLKKGFWVQVCGEGLNKGFCGFSLKKGFWGNVIPQAVAACGSGGGYVSAGCDSLRLLLLLLLLLERPLSLCGVLRSG